MKRRPLILLLVGALATLLGLMASTRIRASRCASRGGEWDDLRRACRLASGASGETVGQVTTAYLLGLVIAVIVAFMLWRIFLFAIGRGPDRRAS
ncbi:MAG TPA: hypothetical protein VEA99_07105 [Gemmatimonadaceae bacterium]|nr:hypothetical protein [Gemmatimonadaceae bacterium]